jgi:hypothetical protein
MAVSISNLTANFSDSSASSFATASISPTSNNLILASVVARRGDSTQPTAPSLSGNGLTWVEITHIDFDTNPTSMKTLWIFRAMGSSPSSGTVTFDFGAQTITNCNWSVDQASGIDTSGTNGSGAIVQSATNKEEGGSGGDGGQLIVTLGAFGSTSNATFGAFSGDAGSGTWTVGSGFTKLGGADSAGNMQHGSEWKSTNDTSVDMTSATTAGQSTGGIAIEIRAAVSETVIAYGAGSNSGVIAATNTTTFNSPNVFGVNKIGWVALFARDATLADTEGSTVTWNGVSMTKAATQKYDTATPYLGVSLWYIIAPADGVTSIVATWTGTIDTGGAIASFFTGAKQSGIPDASNGAQDVSASGTSPSVNVTTVADNSWVIDCVYDKVSPTLTVGGGQTQIAQLAPNGGGDSAASSYEGPKTPAGSVTMSWTASAGDDWATIAASFAPAVAATTFIYPIQRMRRGFG